MTPSSSTQGRPVTAAFYLPQFHQIPENDEWWGDGFTEWTNVRRARPLFDGHTHPISPTSPIGEYDLTDTTSIAWQVQAAQANDVDAFVYYHYWFAGKRLLERPLDMYLDSEHDMPFAICWANENWSRRWDGKDRELLLAQNYDDDSARAVFESFLPYLQDQRYLRLDGKLLLLVHRVDHLPVARRYSDVWRQLATEAGLGELWLVASETVAGLNPGAYGFDAVAEFPPVGDNNLGTVVPRRPSGTSKNFRGRIGSYERLARRYMNRRLPDFPVHRGLVPRWDNTARRGEAATVFIESSPALYGKWLSAARTSEQEARGSGGVVFINAWNEWAEGAFLEPDATFGDRYLRATRWDWEPDSIDFDARSAQARGSLNVRGVATASAASLRNSFRSLIGGMRS
jgi:lipopolysaccharide biosynthesis protein